VYLVQIRQIVYKLWGKYLLLLSRIWLWRSIVKLDAGREN
jgi:hypothetical protein